MVKIPIYSCFEQFNGFQFIQIVWCGSEYPPPHKCGGIVLFHVFEEAYRRGVPTSNPNTTLHFNGYLMPWQCIVKAPSTLRMKSIFFDALFM